MMVERTPSASPTLPSRDSEWASDMTFGCSTPDQPEQKGGVTSGAREGNIGNGPDAIAAASVTLIMTCLAAFLGINRFLNS